MFELDVVQAAFRDCLIARYGTRTRQRMMLIDGGPFGTFNEHLRPALVELAGAGATLDLVVLSHIDNDHVMGLLEMFGALEKARLEPSAETGTAMPAAIKELWHNSFSLSAGGEDIAPRIREALASATEKSAPKLMSLAGTLMGVGEGDALRVAALTLGVPINARFDGRPVLVDNTSTVRTAGMSIDVSGPSTQILERLRAEWLAWLSAHGRGVTAAAAVAADNTTPNLSSIVLLLRAHGRSMLLTGDGRGDHIVDGLGERGLLSKSGKFHVNVLKVPHHGSARNATRDFFAMVTADTYVISANGRYGNPDLECLLSLVDAAGGRPIEIVCTNPTSSLRDLAKQRPPERHGYRLALMAPDAHSLAVSLD